MAGICVSIMTRRDIMRLEDREAKRSAQGTPRLPRSLPQGAGEQGGAVSPARPGRAGAAAALRHGAVCSMVPPAPVPRPGARSAVAFAGAGNPGLSAAFPRRRPPWSGEGSGPAAMPCHCPRRAALARRGGPCRAASADPPCHGRVPSGTAASNPEDPCAPASPQRPIRGSVSPSRRMACRVAGFTAALRRRRGPGFCPPQSPCSVARRRPPPPGQRRPAGRAIGVPD